MRISSGLVVQVARRGRVSAKMANELIRAPRA